VLVAVQGWEFDVEPCVERLGSCLCIVPSCSVITAELLNGEVVGHDDSVEAEFVPQQVREDPVRAGAG